MDCKKTCFQQQRNFIVKGYIYICWFYKKILVWWLHVWEGVTVTGNKGDDFTFSGNGFESSHFGWEKVPHAKINHVIGWQLYSFWFIIRFTKCRYFQSGEALPSLRHKKYISEKDVPIQ